MKQTESRKRLNERQRGIRAKIKRRNNSDALYGIKPRNWKSKVKDREAKLMKRLGVP